MTNYVTKFKIKSPCHYDFCTGNTHFPYYTELLSHGDENLNNS